MKYIIFTISLLVFVGCKDTKNQETKTVKKAEKPQKESINQDTAKVYLNTWINEIELNDGNKWQANAATNEGVLKMKNSIKIQETNSLQDYYQLAEQLDSDKNFVIKNCTMKGASHENLHVWLLPLMAKIEALSKTKSIEEASKLKQSIAENINEYANYFE